MIISTDNKSVRQANRILIGIYTNLVTVDKRKSCLFARNKIKVTVL